MQVSKWIAEKIKYRLKSLGINNTEFATMLNVKPSLISRILSGKHNYTIKTLIKIENILAIKFFTNDIEHSNKCAPCVVEKMFNNNEDKNGKEKETGKETATKKARVYPNEF